MSFAAESGAGLGLRFDCPRCGTRHLIACCHASRHNLCDQCVAEQHADRAVRHASWGTDPSGYCGCDDCNAPDPNGADTRTLPSAETTHAPTRYEPCVIDADGNCTRWSHDHTRILPPGQTAEEDS